MIEHFVSSNIKYSCENENFFKNDIKLLNENSENIDFTLFKSYIQKETSTFIYKSYSNIILVDT